MDGEFHFRDGLPWLLAAVALLVAFFAISILAPGDDFDPEGLALVVIVTALWSVALVGLGLAVKGFGFLVILRDVHRGHAWLVAGATLLAIVAAVILHNLLYAVSGTEEPFFFIFALFVAPPLLIAAVIRALHPGGGSHGRMATPHV